MNYYVLRPDLTPYEGVIVDKDTKLSFKNEKVEQEVKDLELTMITKESNEQYDIDSKMVVHLKEGDVLLLEKDNRGYFLPAEAIGTIETAIKDYRGLAESLDGKNYEVIEK